MSSLLRLLLVFLLTLGVGSIPLGPEGAESGSSMTTAMATSASMADAMPCCPDDAPAMPDCRKSCPLLATCMTICAPAAPVAAFTDAGQVMRIAANFPGDDAVRPSPDTGPPSRPPRS